MSRSSVSLLLVLASITAVQSTATSSRLVPSLPTTVIQPSSTAGLPSAASTSIPLSHTVVHQPLGTVEVGGILQAPITCLNCSASGSLLVKAGGFDFTDDVLESGHFRVEAKGVQVHAELELQASSLEHEFDLARIRILGFLLPGGVVGLYLQIQILVKLQSVEPADVTFGVDFSLPDGAFIDIDVSDLTDSTSYGFQLSEGLTVDTLPVNGNVSGCDFTLSVALKTSLLFGFEFLDDSIYVNAGAFVELPRIVIRENCDTPCRASSSSSNGTYIIPSIQVDVGVGEYAGANAAGNGFSKSDETTLASLRFPLSTTCIDAGAHHAPVTFTPGSISPSTIASISMEPTQTDTCDSSTSTTRIIYGEPTVRDSETTTAYTTLLLTTPTSTAVEYETTTVEVDTIVKTTVTATTS